MKKCRAKFAAYLTRRYGDRSTPKHYLNDLDMFIQQVGSVNPSEVTMQQIDEFIDKQQARGLKPATINRRLASIHTFYEFIASAGLYPDLVNPVQWRRHRIKEGNHLPRDASEADVARLFATIDDKRDKAMFGLMVGAGLRVGEVVTSALSSTCFAVSLSIVPSSTPVSVERRLRPFSSRTTTCTSPHSRSANAYCATAFPSLHLA